MSKVVIQGQSELNIAKRIFFWNKLSLNVLGLWPSSPSDFRFFLCFGIFGYHMILEYLDLFLFIGDLEHVIMNLTENLAFTPIVFRILMTRIHFSKIKVIVLECLQDYEMDKFQNENERHIFLPYMATAKTFVKLMIGNVGMTASSYFVKPIMGRIGADPEQNITLGFELPYRFHMLYEINDTKTYFWTYASQVPFVCISFFGTTAADCLIVILVYHVSGQMAVLASRIRQLPTNNTPESLEEIYKVIRFHIKLMEMGEGIEQSFSITLLVYLLCATIAVCILGYQILTNLGNDVAILVTFLIFMCLILLLLYAQCTVGESLITESDKVYQALYECLWYQMPCSRSRNIIFCMLRAKKPLHLSAGDFGTFYLSTMTDVIRTSMGYLSVLRNFL